jgi:hypothetical protein
VLRSCRVLVVLGVRITRGEDSFGEVVVAAAAGVVVVEERVALRRWRFSCLRDFLRAWSCFCCCCSCDGGFWL